MAIISQSEIEERTGTTYAGANASAITQLCIDVDAAIKKRLAPYYPEPLTKTFYLDAPLSRELRIPYRPVRGITSIYYRPGANGDPSAFTSDDLLTAYTDYQFTVDPVLGYSDSGIVRRIDTLWGWRAFSPPERLGYELQAERGALKVVATIGPAAVPADIALAAHLCVLRLYQFRTTGLPLQSESENGYSYSNASPYTVEAALNSPDVVSLLAPYTSKAGMTLHVG